MKMDIDFWPKNPKANFQNGKMNTSSFNTMNYACPPKPRRRRKQTQFKPKTNPIKAKLLTQDSLGTSL